MSSAASTMQRERVTPKLNSHSKSVETGNVGQPLFYRFMGLALFPHPEKPMIQSPCQR